MGQESGACAVTVLRREESRGGICFISEDGQWIDRRPTFPRLSDVRRFGTAENTCTDDFQ